LHATNTSTLKTTFTALKRGGEGAQGNYTHTHTAQQTMHGPIKLRFVD